MLRLKINQIKICVSDMENTSDENKIILNAICEKLSIHSEKIISYKITKKSIDARKKPDIYFVYTIEVCVKDVPKKVLKDKKIQKVDKQTSYSFDIIGKETLNNRPVIVGFGPAGMFCGYMLAKNGYKPIILERGLDVDRRMEEVEKFFKTGILNEDSNIQFGEGGAGTFSDGKLNTGVNDKNLRNRLVLETFVKFGAPSNILYDAKPHIGTDILCNVVKNIRNYIEEKGGNVYFGNKLTSIHMTDNKLDEITINDNTILPCEVLILAIGHSSRDTFEMLYEKNIQMIQKPFAIGVRVEHRQETINRSMYGSNYSSILPASPYKLTAKTSTGRGVYSFCMCPGGYVVDASSEKNRKVVNGMSYSKRDGENANSAIVTTITPEDFNSSHPLAGMYLQRELEEKAYIEGNGHIPVQKYGDFKNNVTSKSLGDVTPNIKGMYKLSNIKNVLPPYISSSIEECMPKFAQKIKGFDDDDTVLSAIESRTSSPIRIVRNEDFMSTSCIGMYPCGEGAGYAGGITSAAMDGIKVFEEIAKLYKPFA